MGTGGQTDMRNLIVVFRNLTNAPKISTNQSMLYSEKICSQIHTKHINTLCGRNVECRTYRAVNTLCGQNVELLNVKLVVHIVTAGL
jgi:hypothetical protein